MQGYRLRGRRIACKSAQTQVRVQLDVCTTVVLRQQETNQIKSKFIVYCFIVSLTKGLVQYSKGNVTLSQVGCEGLNIQIELTQRLSYNQMCGLVPILYLLRQEQVKLKLYSKVYATDGRFLHQVHQWLKWVCHIFSYKLQFNTKSPLSPNLSFDTISDAHGQQEARAIGQL